MNRLEQYISENKNLFDEEPATGHFERLQQKMNRKSRRIVALSWGVSIAASVAIILSIGIIVQKHPVKQENGRIICENTTDMKSCYINKMNVVAGKIDLLTKNLDSWDRQQVMNDVQNIIDVAGSGFESEIPQELPANETRSILSDYYRQNLESLKSIEKELTTKTTMRD